MGGGVLAASGVFPFFAGGDFGFRCARWPRGRALPDRRGAWGLSHRPGGIHALPPPSHGLCCLPNAAGDEIECEDRSALECTAAGGVSKGNGVCALDTCADVTPPNPDIQCCVPHNGGFECKDRTDTECAAQGGTNVGSGACSPSSCDGL